MRRTTLAAAVLVSTSSLALAANDAPRWFQQMDHDNDGTLTQAEVKAGSEAAFAKFDRDSDMLVSAEEFLVYHKSVVGLDETTEVTREDYEQARVTAEPFGPPRYGDLDMQGGTVTEQDFEAAVQEDFDRLDRDHDRALNAAEWERGLEETFAEADVDRDALVTPIEAISWERGQPVAITADGEDAHATSLAAFDADGDGYATPAEVMAYNDRKFERQDVDGNGVLTPSEWDLRAQEHFGYRVAPEELDVQTESTFAEHDADGDNRVTKAEWDARIRAEFARIDGDADSQIDPDELAKRPIDLE